MLNIKIIDNAFRHCEYSNNPLPPLQKCEDIVWNRDILNINSNETLFATEYDIKSDIFINHNGIKNAWLIECRDINDNLYKWLEFNYSKFTNVLTHDYEFVKLIPNAIWVPFGGCWIDKKDWMVYEKYKHISIVASDKNSLPGHKLRHKVIGRFSIDLYGSGYNPIQYKLDSLKDYKYQIVIENSSIPGYFTEKLIDCFMTGTIPIYFGDPLIGNIFNSKGIIDFKTIDDLESIIENIENININNNILVENFNIAKNYILSEDYIYKNYKNLL